MEHNGSGINEVPNYEEQNCKLKINHNMKNKTWITYKLGISFYAMLAVVKFAELKT